MNQSFENRVREKLDVLVKDFEDHPEKYVQVKLENHENHDVHVKPTHVNIGSYGLACFYVNLIDDDKLRSRLTTLLKDNFDDELLSLLICTQIEKKIFSLLMERSGK